MTKRHGGLTPTTVLFLAQIAVASAAILARLAMSTGLTPLALAGWRLLIAASLIVLWRDKSRSKPTISDIAKLVLAGVFLAFHFVFWFESLNRESVARSTLLVSTNPIFCGVFLMVFLRQWPSLRFWVGLTVAMAGLFLFLKPDQQNMASTWVGDTFALLGAAAIAVYLLIVSPIRKRIDAVTLVSYTYSSAATSICIATVLFQSDKNVIPRSTAAIMGVIGMALIPQVVGHTALNWCLDRLSAAFVAGSSLLEPVFAAILALIIFCESITIAQALGGVITIVGVMWLLRQDDA